MCASRMIVCCLHFYEGSRADLIILSNEHCRLLFFATTQAQQKEACQHGTTLPLCHAIQSRLFCLVAGELSSVNSGEYFSYLTFTWLSLGEHVKVKCGRISSKVRLRCHLVFTWPGFMFCVRVWHLGCQWGKNISYGFRATGLRTLPCVQE